MIERLLEESIIGNIFKGKAIIILGARQVGKTTLLKKIAGKLENVLWLNADTIEVQALLEDSSSTRFRSIIRNSKIIIIDEAQRIKNIGIKLKIIIDEISDIQIIATGSSSFDLSNEINEPLTGRKYEYNMFPLSFEEMVNHHSLFDELNLLEQRMIYGYYS